MVDGWSFKRSCTLNLITVELRGISRTAPSVTSSATRVSELQRLVAADLMTVITVN